MKAFIQLVKVLYQASFSRWVFWIFIWSCQPSLKVLSEPLNLSQLLWSSIILGLLFGSCLASLLFLLFICEMIRLFFLFFYFFLLDNNNTGTAYDLECVEHFETNPNDYYTMSKQGIYNIYFFERIFFVWGGLSIIYTY